MITLHHLNFSRSTRVLWLLEELSIEYRLVSYQRTEQFRAPPELANVHPLGKAPIIEDGDLILAESSVILDYLNVHYGNGRLAPLSGSKEAALHEQWLQYVESSAGLPILFNVIGTMTGGLPERLQQFTKSSVTKTLDYISDGLGAGPHLMGEPFTIADIQMSYLLELAKSAGLVDGRKVIDDYLDHLRARPALAKALDLGGPMTRPRL
jgi:glutathione S-transferase